MRGEERKRDSDQEKLHTVHDQPSRRLKEASKNVEAIFIFYTSCKLDTPVRIKSLYLQGKQRYRIDILDSLP